MIINYTYKEPAERPIEKAEFESSLDSNCLISMLDQKYVSIGFCHRNVVFAARYFNKLDLADLIALLQRFHKQLPEVE